MKFSSSLISTFALSNELLAVTYQLSPYGISVYRLDFQHVVCDIPLSMKNRKDNDDLMVHLMSFGPGGQLWELSHSDILRCWDPWTGQLINSVSLHPTIHGLSLDFNTVHILQSGMWRTCPLEHVFERGIDEWTSSFGNMFLNVCSQGNGNVALHCHYQLQYTKWSIPVGVSIKMDLSRDLKWIVVVDHERDKISLVDTWDGTIVYIFSWVECRQAKFSADSSKIVVQDIHGLHVKPIYRDDLIASLLYQTQNKKIAQMVRKRLLIAN